VARPTDAELNLDVLHGRQRLDPAPPDSKVEKWRRWLKEIDGEITTMWLNRDVWKTVNQLVSDNPILPPSHFFEFMAQTYATAQAAAVRRQAEVSDRVVSLGTLLTEIAGDPQRLTRQRFVGAYDWGMQWMGDEAFDERFAGPGADDIDPGRVADDLVRLNEAAMRIKGYVDQHVAHYDRSRRLDEIPTFDNLDTAIDVLGDLLRRYILLLEQADRAMIAPVPQYDWLGPFRVPWLPS
jgi:hypothetical protein